MDRKEIDGHIIDLDMMGDKPVIIDAGCNRGDFIGFTDENFDTSFIYAIECDVRHVKYLNETYLNHNDLKFYDNALYGVDGEEVIFTQFNGQKKGDGTDRYHQWGNIVGVNKDFLGKRGVDIEEYTVKTISISKIIEDNKLDKIDYLKMDIEGAEYSVIEEMSQAVADKISQISMETHIENKNSKLIKNLKSLGFTVEEHKRSEIYAYKK